MKNTLQFILGDHHYPKIKKIYKDITREQTTDKCFFLEIDTRNGRKPCIP